MHQGGYIYIYIYNPKTVDMYILYDRIFCLYTKQPMCKHFIAYLAELAVKCIILRALGIALIWETLA